jgi:hypothetical protein
MVIEVKNPQSESKKNFFSDILMAVTVSEFRTFIKD